MPAVNVLIKPASSACNMNCTYCFYKDIAENRATPFNGMLSIENLEKTVSSAMDFAQGSCSFVFQGGEPTLAGLDFYKKLVEFEKKYAKAEVQIFNSIQTNGFAIDREWAGFLAENKFLVGLSLDGPKSLHDYNRKTADGGPTYERIMETVALFNEYNVDYNVLCVLTGKNARNAKKIYQFCKQQGFKWIQFIPCLEPLSAVRGTSDYQLSVKNYGDFLIEIFDLWYQDFKNDNYISIRHIDNWILAMAGRCPESCDMTGRCSIQFVVEGDGDVYPCDFYVLDEWRLGRIGENSFAELAGCDKAKQFVAESLSVPGKCKACRFFSLCRNGCRRNRIAGDMGQPINYYCNAYRRFFTEREKELRAIGDRYRWLKSDQ